MIKNIVLVLVLWNIWKCRDAKVFRRKLKQMSKSTDAAETNYLGTIWSYRCSNPLDRIIDRHVICVV